MLSAVVTANGAVLAGSRAAFAVARDGSAPQWLGQVNRFKAPANSVLAIGGWAILLIVLSGVGHRLLFDVLISYVMFGYLLFQGLVSLSLILLRRAHPEWPRPFRVPGYPFTPIASIAATIFLMVAVGRSNTVEVFAGLILIAAGLPVWWIFKRSTIEK